MQGKVIEVNGLSMTMLDMVQMRSGRDAAWWRNEQKKVLAKPTTYQTRNDYAVTLLHLGNVPEALRILIQIEKTKPGLYATAANIGTANELAGKDAEALRWIRESIRRNANAHLGTEWVHVAVLEAKLAQQRDPHWLDAHSVLGADFGSDSRPRIIAKMPRNNTGAPVDAKGMRDAIFYQLSERLQFVGPPDPYVADLFFDWGNAEALTGTVQQARKIYGEALRFGTKRPELVKKRIAYMKRVKPR